MDHNEKCRKFYSDMMESFNFNFNPETFKRKSGFFFPEMQKNTALYIKPASSELKSKLKECRSKGIKVILITASHIDFAELLMTFSYGADWREYFDMVCCRARKPGFFSMSAEERPFYCWDSVKHCNKQEPVQELNSRDVFMEGHWSVVDKWIRRKVDKAGRIAYVGDSFRSDIVPTKLSSTWDLFAVVLEGEEYRNSGEHVSSNTDHVDKKRHVSVEGWGSFFGTADQPTMFGGKLLEHADLTISDVEELASLRLDQDFSSSKPGNFLDFNPYYK